MSIQDILPFVEHPSRYLGTETNSVHKDLRSIDLRFALVFPDLYEIGMSHFGLQILYHILNKNPRVAAERVFAPADDMARRLKDLKRPLFSLESRLPLHEFDIVGFSLLYELDYTNILTILDLAGIPFFAADRDETHPIVIAGGPCVCNPEPVADFFDAMVVGDGETVTLDLVRSWLAWKAEGRKNKQALLKTWSQYPGVYIPAFYRSIDDGIGGPSSDSGHGSNLRVRRAILSDLNQSEFPAAPIVPFGKPVHDRLRIEVARGCTRGCRFCQAGMIYRPVRERAMSDILHLAQRSLENTGYEDLSLLSLSTGDYACIEQLMGQLMSGWADEHVAVSLPSLRAGTLTPEIMHLIKRVRKTGFTIAPEAGSQRLRDVINKNINEQEIIDTVRNAFQMGWQVIKLYFMIGLPTEGEADLESIVSLVRELNRLRKQHHPRGNINVSVTTFIPKAHTPFQWAPQLGVEASRHKIFWLKEKLNQRGIQFKWQQPEVSQLEGLWARGDRRLSRLLITAWQNGCRFDGWTDHFDYRKWLAACEKEGIDLAGHAARVRSFDTPLPWDHIDTGVTKDYLWAEYQNALNGKPTADCRNFECLGCGVCDHETLAPVICSDCRSSQAPLHRMPLEMTSFSYKLQIGFSKTHAARYFGHLETVKIFNRALKRAGIPVKYSEGYHPKAKLNFRDALPIGLESLDEVLALTLTEDMDPADVMNLLNRQLPEGLVVHTCQKASPGAAPDTNGRKVYRVILEGVHLDKSALQRFNQAKVMRVERTTAKGRTTSLDLKSVVACIEFKADTIIELSLLSKPERTLRPVEVVRHIFGLNEETLKKARIIKLLDG